MLLGPRAALVVVVWEAGAAYVNVDVDGDPGGADATCARPR